MNYVAFNPKKHEGKQLYEQQTVDKDDVVEVVIVESSTPFEVAAKTPWYYLVEETS